MNRSLALFEDPPLAAGEAAAGDTTSPRVYRNRILKLRRAGQRRAALANIADPATRAVVRFYIEDHFARLHHRPLPDFQMILRDET